MSRQTTGRIKINPPLGKLPVLQYLPPAELAVDASYQRSIEGGDSQSLIRRIAQHWNWDLCQPLLVSRRRGDAPGGGDRYFVIDGQHRLEAARLRGDIGQLPCVVGEYGGAAEEASVFVHLNQERKPLKRLDLFKSAVASGNKEACAILAAIGDAGLSLAPHTNYASWKPGMVANISGIEASWRRNGERVTALALRALAQAFAGEVLQYAGTLFPGIAAVCADEIARSGAFSDQRFECFQTMLVLRGQLQWRRDIHARKGEQLALNFAAAAEHVMRAAWAAADRDPPKRAAPALPPTAPAKAAPPPVPSLATVTAYPGSRWCGQCEQKVTHGRALACRSQFCSMRKARAA